MTKRTRLNLHCHSDLSDGSLPPESLASALARGGVHFVALTDHDSTVGTQRFREAAEHEGMECFTGVEMTAYHAGVELHLLGYGFDLDHTELQAALKALRRNRATGFHAALDSAVGLAREAAGSKEPHRAENGVPPTAECANAIGLLHRAGGKVFLAHPLFAAPDLDELDRLLTELKALGLDGVEAYYAPYPVETRESLAELARKHALLVCGGTDFHGNEQTPPEPVGIDMPTPLWKEFRDAVALPAASRPAGEPRRPHPGDTALDQAFRWRQFLLRIILPAVLTIALFVGELIGVFLPATERSMLERKRENSKDLTALAISILDEYREEVRQGELETEAAQRLALQRLRDMHYGPEGKDYFWVTDMQPRMLMHPYRSDLEGEDLSDFRDPEGKRVFAAFVEEVSDDGEGFVRYMWQWKDDPARVAPKLSYVKLYEPWDWIVGTGIYLDDVEAEITELTNSLARISLAITALVAVLLFFIAQQSLKLERQRRRAGEALRYSHEKYRTLVESAGHGSLMVLEGRCAYANRPMLELLGYTEDELRLHDLADLLPNAKPEENETVRHFTDLLEGKPAPTTWRGELRTRDGGCIEAQLSVKTIALNGRTGLVITLGGTSHEPGAILGEGPQTDRQLTQDLHTSLLFLNEPIQTYVKPALTCPLRTPACDAAAFMGKAGASAVLVAAESGDPIGIVTDADLRSRIVASRMDVKRPIFEIMSSPLAWATENTLVYQAMLRMQDQHIQHLVVRGADGSVAGIVRNRDLLQFPRYAGGVVAKEVQHAERPEDILAARRRLPAVVTSLLNAGARPQSVMRVIASVHDASTEKLLRLAMDRLGPPPARFAFLCMGSQGRQEETLVTDQDNGIIYEDLSDGADAAASYFEELGRQVCEWLDAVGYEYCRGGVMARNELWRGPLAQWKDRLGTWISAGEPSDILKFDMVFDFRCVYGAPELASALRRFVFAHVERHPAFLLHFARNTLQYKPPLGWFGQIGARSGNEGGRTVNLKDAMMCVVKYARIYAVREGFAEANTLGRLQRMAQMGLVTEEGYEETAAAYELLMRLRLNHQADAIAAEQQPDNAVPLAELTHIESKALREAFNQVLTIQKQLSYDFLGMDQT